MKGARGPSYNRVEVECLRLDLEHQAKELNRQTGSHGQAVWCRVRSGSKAHAALAQLLPHAQWRDGPYPSTVEVCVFSGKADTRPAMLEAAPQLSYLGVKRLHKSDVINRLRAGRRGSGGSNRPAYCKVCSAKYRVGDTRCPNCRKERYL